MSEDGDAPGRRAGDSEPGLDVFEQVPIILGGLTGPEHRFDAANAAYRALMGRADVIGEPSAQLFPELLSQQVLELCDQVYESGKPASIREWRFQFGVGEARELQEFYMDVTFAPRRAADGSVTGLTLWAVDATERVAERQAAHRQASEAERRYEAARDVIDELQQALLPTGLPVLPGVQIAASYLLAEADTAAGGDWYDAIPLSDGRVGLMVGDVVGHGVAASAVMGGLHTLLRDRLKDGEQLVAAVDHLGRHAARTPGAKAATVCVAVLDTADGSLAYTTAGHPPPLVLAADGQTCYLAGTGGGPLGTGSSATVGQDRLGEGETLLLYSDGIIERPGRSAAQSTVELAKAASAAALHRIYRLDEPTDAAERVCTQSLELLVRAAGYADDITLLAAQRVPEPAPLALTVPAEPASVGRMRLEFERWLSELGVGEDDALGLHHALGELVTNAVEHAYAGGGGEPARDATVQVSAALTAGGEVQAMIGDHGRWRQPREAPERGRGLAMAGDFVDDLYVDRADTGSTVTLRRRLSRSARIFAAAPTGTGDVRRRPGAQVPYTAQMTEQPSPRLRVAGPLDIETAADLRAVLLRATRGGTRTLTADLTEVTHLASVAVQALYEATNRSADQGSELLLFAPPESPAGHVLALVALPYTTADPDGLQPEQLDPDISAGPADEQPSGQP